MWLAKKIARSFVSLALLLPLAGAVSAQTPPPAAAPAESEEIPPRHLVIGIGAGYMYAPGGSFDLETPNFASVRVRLGSGLTFEPFVDLNGTWDTTSPGMGAMSTTDSTGEIGLGTLVRYPVIRSHRFEFQLVGDLEFQFSRTDPTGDNNASTLTSFTLGWGIGIGYWIARHWEVTTTAVNPLFSLTHQTQDVAANDTSSTTTTSAGAIFAPSIMFMIHLYD